MAVEGDLPFLSFSFFFSFVFFFLCLREEIYPSYMIKTSTLFISIQLNKGIRLPLRRTAVENKKVRSDTPPEQRAVSP